MSHQVSWIRDDGDRGMQTFDTEQDAMDHAQQLEGTAMVSRMPSGSVTVFEHGRELEGEEASRAFSRFSRDFGEK